MDPTIPEQERERAIRRVLIIEMILNLLVALAKGAYGIWSGALALTTDAVHSTVDAMSNIVGMIAIRIAAAPPDPEHPYGHRKVEIFAATVLGFAVGATAVRFVWDAAEALIRGHSAPTTTTAGFVIIIGTFAVNIFVAVYEARRARQLDSAYLAADAAHTASDVLVTIAVLGSFTAAHYGVRWADPIGALIVVAVIARIAWLVIVANARVLIDRAVVDAAEVASIAEEIDGVLDCHRVRSRGTKRMVHVDLHLLVDGDLSVRDAHEIGNKVEASLKERLPEIVDVTVHVEPEEEGREGL